MELGRSRANKVGAFLAANGIRQLRMMKRSFGSTAPLSNKDTPSGWAMNRRVDVYIDKRGQR